MLCEECGKRPASVHITKVVNGEKTERHLCEECARELEDFSFSFQPNFTIHNLLAGLLDSAKESPIGVNISQKIQCPFCGMTFNQFSQYGRFGCSQCYGSFHGRIEPILRRIHGSHVHTGKVPRRTGGKIRLKKEIDKLKRQLEQAVKKEEFEKAAELRDKIRELENQIGRE
ncbi:Protein-arginine kinase activator protein [Koleobacter methoxysyntrophicus]|uniref:Protein-arginine kinase activator protein n=1 Tax=Koleobacter methoxysyntrophicus TaxID=2751313 RepID=A0A8A0RM99_9FIRM|nr:UvrB/UvrC motif-containing protein [Koleobacter methoxysyntrophicus]QSQ08326.1 Protein-arginine kinase activator protein [Koleobacter methoxysyntrophicus]